MKKILRYKVFMAVVIVILLVLLAFSMAAFKLKLTPCENEPDHFIDEFGNGYCIAKELVSDFKNTAVFVLEDSSIGQPDL